MNAHVVVLMLPSSIARALTLKQLQLLRADLPPFTLLSTLYPPKRGAPGVPGVAGVEGFEATSLESTITSGQMRVRIDTKRSAETILVVMLLGDGLYVRTCEGVPLDQNVSRRVVGRIEIG